MKATIFLSEDDIKNMLIERWAPRSDRYTTIGPEAGRPVRIKDMHFSAYGASGSSGWVEFTDEPEEKPVEPAPESSPTESPQPLSSDTDDDLPF